MNKLFLYFGLLALLSSVSQPLCDPIAAGSIKFLGNITASGTAIPSNFKDYWNQLTPENAGKWGSVEQTRGTMNWRWLDTAYNYAKNNKMPFKAHTLIWGFQEPNWMGGLTAAQQRDAAENWIKSYGERYPDADMVDVVNEPMSRPVSFRDAIGGSGTTGWDWVIWSFEMAKKYFPKSKLLLNEFNIVNSGERTDRYVQLATLLKERNLIDGIGVQSHYFSIQGGTSADTIRNNLDKLALTGLPIYSSEMDIIGSDTIQLNDYKNIFPIFWKHPAVVGVTLWGWLQGYTWADSSFLIRKNGIERPSLKWLREYVSREAGILSLPRKNERKTLSPFSLTLSINEKINLHVRRQANLGLRIVDLQGRTVAAQAIRFFSTGDHSIESIAKKLPSGVYRVSVIENRISRCSILFVKT
jgi:endo-1,4-beta-xylanase